MMVVVLVMRAKLVPAASVVQNDKNMFQMAHWHCTKEEWMGIGVKKEGATGRYVESHSNSVKFSVPILPKRRCTSSTP